MKYKVLLGSDNALYFSDDNGNIVEPALILDDGEIIVEEEKTAMVDQNGKEHTFYYRNVYYLTKAK